MHCTSHIRVLRVIKDCVCPIIYFLSRHPDLSLGLRDARPTLYALSYWGRQSYEIWWVLRWWNVILNKEGIMQIVVVVDRMWCYRLQLTLVSDRPMCRQQNPPVESRRGLLGVHEFGITFLVGNVNSPCSYTKTRMHHTSHIRVILAPKVCVCPIVNSESRDSDVNPGLLVASPTLYALSQRGRQCYDIWWILRYLVKCNFSKWRYYVNHCHCWPYLVLSFRTNFSLR